MHRFLFVLRAPHCVEQGGKVYALPYREGRDVLFDGGAAGRVLSPTAARVGLYLTILPYRERVALFAPLSA